MVRKCMYCSEKADGDESGERRSFHTFPLKEGTLQSWLQNMEFDRNFKVKPYMKLCSAHFTDDCFEKSLFRSKLKKGCIPTLFIKRKSTCIFCKAIKNNESHCTFHKFPLQNPELLNKWIAAVGSENFFPEEDSLLCSDQREKECFEVFVAATRPQPSLILLFILKGAEF